MRAGAMEAPHMGRIPENFLPTATEWCLCGIGVVSSVCQTACCLFHLVRAISSVPTGGSLDIRIKEIMFIATRWVLIEFQPFRQVKSVQYFSKGSKEGRVTVCMKLADDTKLAGGRRN